MVVESSIVDRACSPLWRFGNLIVDGGEAANSVGIVWHYGTKYQVRAAEYLVLSYLGFSRDLKRFKNERKWLW